ncbi:putative transporter svop-1 [Epargyreus clarus]|uniref:putative transporter svop-1 n=1 Tax=Epargyreus clarus TaxID=520877 RepID=UPI003C2B31FD
MEVCERNSEVPAKCSFEDALNLTGFGKYNFFMLTTCCCLIMAMYLDIFGFSVVLPSVACDLGLTTSQQGMLSAVSLIGIMASSYAWGICADTLGRRTTLLFAMPVGVILGLAVSVAPTFETLAVLKFLSGAFTASANAAAFVLQGESVPCRQRSRFMFLMASATMVVQFVICSIGLPIFRLTFRINIAWLSLDYRPWRLLLQIISLPGILGVIGLLFMKESPKFLLSKGQDDAAINVLKSIYRWNTGLHPNTYPVTSVFLEETLRSEDVDTSFVRRMWNQTAPLFKPPLLKNSLKLYYMLLCAYMTSTGYTMWLPTMTNAYFNGEDSSGKTFCEVASTAATSSSSNSTTVTDCDNVIQPLTLYAVMFYSGLSGTLNILLTFLVEPLGKRRTTHLIFCASIVCGILLLFVRVPLLSIILFYNFLYVALILGNVNTYLVELNPTYLRGMATCLSVLVARGFGFFSVQLIASMLADHCTPMVSGYIALVISGLIVSIFLPPDVKKTEDQVPRDIQQTEYYNNISAENEKTQI